MRHLTIALTLVAVTAGWSAVEIENADFTGSRGELPPGWIAAGDAATLFTINDADGAAGTTCLQYRSDAERGETFLEQSITLTAETEYVLSAWLKSDGITRPAVAVLKTGERNFAAILTSDGSTTWTRFRVRFNSGDTTDAVVRTYGDYGPGRASRSGASGIDAITLALASEATDGEPLPGGYAGPPPGENLALGKPYTWSQAPNYSLCTDEGDSTQLTDGKHTVGYFWVQKSTVGWTLRRPLQLTIDLGASAPISGVALNTAGGAASVGYPGMIFVLTSDDGESFAYQGELVALSGQYGLPEPQRYVIHRYCTDRLRAAGRYVRFVVCPGSAYLFTDEVEVYRGGFAIADASPGEPVESTDQLVADHRLDGIVGVREMYDIQDLRATIARAGIPAATKTELNARLDALAEEVRAQHVEEVEHWRGLPYDDLHARIYAVNAALRRAEGHPELSVWPAARWDMLDPMTAPGGGEARVELLAMNGEHRSAAFNVTNLMDEPAIARVEVTLEGADPGIITVHEVQYVQTQEREVTSSALPVADAGPDGRARVPVPAGMTKQAWLTVHPVGAAPGIYRGSIEVQIATERFEVPLRVEIAPLTMVRPPVAVFCWDYVGDKVNYAPGFTDLDAMARNLEEHFVDAPWASAGVLPWPEDGTIDAQGHLTGTLDFGALDRWVDRFPNARLYLIYASMNSGNFRGTSRGTERWATALGEWASAITEHLQARGIGPERWALLIIDEPSTEPAEQIIVDVARALKAAVPELQVFEDPVRADPTQALPELYEVSDILCPNLPRLEVGGQKAIDFYQALAEQGKRLCIYQCSGPHKLLDPITYHRAQFWHAWNLGATGSGYWGYVDSAGTGSSWDNFKGGGTSYSMVYADDQNHLADSKQWEAVREGAEDYAYLAMLRDAVAAHEGEDTAAVRAARELLETLPEEAAGSWEAGGMRWADPRDRSGLDTARERVLRALMALEG